ncbi:MAG: hypothetical protein KUG78_19525 [Kangiellaceae bacterium]|nr:hypothetical protein [Kangiellaceae bacterium]
MNQQIVSVKIDPIDQACLQITLRQLPNRLKFWGTNHSQLKTYKGYGRNWYQLPSFKPATHQTTCLLKEISRSPKFKHLRYKLHG